MPELRGAFAASVTPLREGGEALDEEAIGPLVDFLAGSGLDGMLALGTTGEGILLSADERKRAAGRFVEAASGRLAVIVHCGAQTTAQAVELAAHAAETGADAVAAIDPDRLQIARGLGVQHSLLPRIERRHRVETAHDRAPDGPGDLDQKRRAGLGGGGPRVPGGRARAAEDDQQGRHERQRAPDPGSVDRHVRFSLPPGSRFR